MGNTPPDKKLQRKIDQIEEDAWKRYKKDKNSIEIFMIYGIGCPVCHRVFRMYIESGDEFPKEIFPIEQDTKWGRQLFEESDAWKQEMKDADLSIRYTPTFLDAKTHAIIVWGMQSKEAIKNMIDPEIRDAERKKFKMKMKMAKRDDCDHVACGLPQRVKELEKEEDEIKA